MNINLVSLSDFRKNQKRYIQLAKKEKVFVTQRGTSEVIELIVRDKIEISNLERAITKDELLKGIEADIDEIYGS